MTHSWREHADAVDEYRAAAQRYESKRPGLGEMFMDAVDAAIESILDRSITWGFYRDRKWTPQVYSRSVPGFPFDIVYVMFEGEVVVVPTHTRDVNPDTGRGDWRAERLVMPIAPCSCIGVPDRRVIPRLQWGKTVERTPPRKGVDACAVRSLQPGILARLDPSRVTRPVTPTLLSVALSTQRPMLLTPITHPAEYRIPQGIHRVRCPSLGHP